MRAARPAGEGIEIVKRACDCHVHVFGPPERYPFSAYRKYTPPQAGVEKLLGLQEKLALERVVMVQASPYGTDNRCLLDSLQRLGKRARGVAVIDQDTSLIPMHGLGVRGVRMNLQTGGERDPAIARRLIEQAARRVAPLGWHLQLWTDATMLLKLRDYLAELPVPLVIDHFGLARSAADAAPLLSLLHRGNTWIKLSAPHRVGDEVDEVARLFIAARPDRLVWGTDWPHPGMGPRTAQVIQPFDDIDDAAALARLARWAASETVLQKILVDNPARLYDFQESA
jgi:predicted TIM-barrel fold metal-dependent hydrolase